MSIGIEMTLSFRLSAGVRGNGGSFGFLVDTFEAPETDRAEEEDVVGSGREDDDDDGDDEIAEDEGSGSGSGAGGCKTASSASASALLG